MAEPRLGETITAVVNVATGATVERCAVTGTLVPRGMSESRKRGWLLLNAAQLKARGAGRAG